MDIEQIDQFARGRTVSKIDQMTVGHVAIHFKDGTHINVHMTIDALDEDREYLSFTAKNAAGWDWDETLGRQDHHAKS